MTIDDHPANLEIVQQIHNEFRAAQKIYVTSLEEELSNLSKTEELEMRIRKAEKMRSLGFIQAIGSDIKRSELDKIKKTIEEKQKLLDIVMSYNVKYPIYKFISEEEVERLCNKYNLLLGSVFRFTGEIPDANLEEIIRFNELIDEDDIPEERVLDESLLQRESIDVLFRKYVDIENSNSERRSYYSNYSSYSLGPAPFKICAPAELMDMEGAIVSDGFKVEVSDPISYPDPVVLQPVHKGYLIVTAWGNEASDPLVVNPIRN